MKKKNLLFINVMMFFVCATISFLIYAKYNTYEDILIINNSNFLRNISIWIGIPALLSLLASIPLGRAPTKESTRNECIIIEVLLTVLLIIVSLIVEVQSRSFGSGLFNDIYVNELSNYIYIYFGLGIVSYVLFLMLVLMLRFIKVISFNEFINIDKDNRRRGLYIIASLVSFTIGIIGTVLYIFFIGGKSLEIFKEIDVPNYGIVIPFALVYLFTGIFLCLKNPKIYKHAIYNVSFVVIAIILYFVLRNINGYNYANLSLVYSLYAFLGGLLFVLLCYSLRPFVRYIVSSDKNELEYSTKEDFINLSEALVKSNRKYVDLINELKENQKNINNDKKEETNPYVYHLEDENKILRNRLEELEKRIGALESIKTDSVGTKDATSDESTLANAPHYETETVSVIRRGFKAKLINDATDEIRECYKDLLNICNKYKKTKVRESFAKEVIHVGRNNVAILKMSPSAKAMYLYLDLDKSYLDSKYHLKDYSEKKAYQKTPLRLRIKSQRSMQYAKELLQIVLDNNAEKYVKDREDIDLSHKLKPQTEEEMIINGLIKKHVVENTYLVEPVYEDHEVVENDDVNDDTEVDDEEDED